MGSGVQLFAKAHTAQYLIADAWHKTRLTNTPVKPWPWADTHPLAKLSFAGQEQYVLAGASGRTLAFAPGHMSATPLPGEQGNSVIVGHRDTHFSGLSKLVLGDIIHLQSLTTTQQYRVQSLNIVHQSQTEVLLGDEYNILSLITCYPFDSALINPQMRYVVVAQKIES